jgi:uncharacterized protein (DUF1015 family)
MVMLRPFRALRYNPAVVGDLSAVVAPPYDVISDVQRDALYQRSERNVVRLILNRAADPYGAARERLTAWRREGVLIREAAPALFYHVEDFALPDGAAGRRQGIMGVVRLEPFRSGHIRPHERTFAQAKDDRMRLLRACRTNLSPIFGLFADKAQALDPARALAATQPPAMSLRDESGTRHQLWLVREANVIEAVASALRDESIVIADGHHRYETALSYHEQLCRQGAADADAAHAFVLMYLTSMTDPGLVILPTHRVVSGLARFDASDLVQRLQCHFRITRFDGSARTGWLANLRQAPQQGRFGVALAGGGDLLVATLGDPAVLEQYTATVAPVVRRLDVTVLDAVILRGLLGIDCTTAAQAGRLTYTHDDETALRAVEQGAQAAFLMNPPRIDDVQAVCQAGETMPQKSTYFYPKLLTGLVFHPLDDADTTASTTGNAAPPVG